MLQKKTKKKEAPPKARNKKPRFCDQPHRSHKNMLLLVPPSRLADRACAVCRMPCRLLSLSSQKKAVMRSEEGAGMISLVSPEYETMYLVYSVPKYVQYGRAGFSAFVFAFYFFFATTQFTKVGVRLTT